jgi:hypothetical protein
MYKIELALASQMRSSDDRYNASLSEFMKTISQLGTSYDAVDWTQFFTYFGDSAPQEVKNNFADPNYQVTVPNPDTIKSMFDAIKDTNTNQITGNDVANYLNLRVIWDLA